MKLEKDPKSIINKHFLGVKLYSVRNGIFIMILSALAYYLSIECSIIL